MALNLIVVADSTTLIALSNINKLDLLKHFSQKIAIPKAVFNEVFGDKNISCDSSFIEVVDIQNISLADGLRLKLDKGESEAITLAIELNAPLIIDEKKGRAFAKELGVKTIGLVGILAIFRRKDILGVNELRELIESLKCVNFWITEGLERFIFEA